MDPVEAPRPRTRRGSGAITIQDVARLAGVSPITVSRVVNGAEHVSPELRARVTAAIDRIGYVPNLLAGGLASSRSHLVAAIVPALSGALFLETVDALTEALAADGYQVLLGQGGYADHREELLLAAILGRRPDGIVLAGTACSPAMRRCLIGSRIPIVEAWDLVTSPMDMSVGFSHDEVGHAVAEFLIAGERRTLAVVAAVDPRSLRRRDAFCARARKAGQADVVTIEVEPPSTVSAGRAALARLLERSPRVDSVFCSSDHLALGVMAEARSRGLDVPDRLAVVGFGDLAFAAALEPALTSVRIDGQAIGRHAAACILDRVAGRTGAGEHRETDVGFEIVRRASA